MRTKAQHIVPQFYLRAFRSRAGRTPDDDYIWCYFKPTGLCREQKISKVAFETRFYDWTAPDGHVISAEQRLLGRLEDLFKPAIDAVLSEPCHHVLAAHRSRLSYFLACQSMRTSGFRKILQEAYRLSAGEESATSSQQTWRHLNFMRLYLHPAAAIYESKRWMLIHNNTDMLLYTSDNPVALHQRERDGRRHIGLVETGVETSMPLSPHLALLICDRSEPLPDGLEIEARRTDIAFLNVHQTWSSDRCLFSANDNFDTARAMIAKFPELTDPSRARLETID